MRRCKRGGKDGSMSAMVCGVESECYFVNFVGLWRIVFSEFEME